MESDHNIHEKNKNGMIKGNDVPGRSAPRSRNATILAIMCVAAIVVMAAIAGAVISGKTQSNPYVTANASDLLLNKTDMPQEWSTGGYGPANISNDVPSVTASLNIWAYYNETRGVASLSNVVAVFDNKTDERAYIECNVSSLNVFDANYVHAVTGLIGDNTYRASSSSGLSIMFRENNIVCTNHQLGR
jgi:hypothetical protein